MHNSLRDGGCFLWCAYHHVKKPRFPLTLQGEGNGTLTGAPSLDWCLFYFPLEKCA